MAENKYLDEHGLATLVDQVRIFRGTRQQWDLLSTAQKKLYSGAEIEEDTPSGAFDIYSETETRTNKVWIDGKPIYRKVIDCGALPNTGRTETAAGIGSTLDTLINIYGVAITSSKSTWPLPFSSTTATQTVRLLYVGTTDKIEITTVEDATNFGASYVTVEYTKTTD